MNIGMLWFDNDPIESLENKVEKAITFYKKKYGQSPNLCFVHPHTKGNQACANIEIRTTLGMLPNHFWIGLKTKEDQLGMD